MIHTRQAHTLGLKLKLIGQAGGVGAKQPDVYLVTEQVSLSLPGLQFRPPRLVALSLDAAEACINEFVVDEQGRNVTGKQSAAKREVDGILGKQFFDQFVVEIDYARRVLNVYDRSSYKYSGSGQIVPIEIGEQHIFLRAQIIAAGRAPLTGRFLIDTGSAQAVTLMKPFIFRHNLLPPTEGMTSLPVCGLGGHAKEKSWMGSRESVQLGEIKIAGPVTEFQMLDPNTDADGFIGGALLRRHRVIFDYVRQRMILEPIGNPSFGASGAVGASAAEVARLRGQEFSQAVVRASASGWAASEVQTLVGLFRVSSFPFRVGSWSRTSGTTNSHESKPRKSHEIMRHCALGKIV
jgi:hypothetical protein